MWVSFPGICGLGVFLISYFLRTILSLKNFFWGLGRLLFTEYEAQHRFNFGHCMGAFADSGPFWPPSHRIAHFPPRAGLRFTFFFSQCFHTLSCREKSRLKLDRRFPGREPKRRANCWQSGTSRRSSIVLRFACVFPLLLSDPFP